MNRPRSNSPQTIENLDPMNVKYSSIIENLREFRLSIMNNRENFCHAASIFKDNGKEQYLKLLYWV
jgi:hypothetical protein